MKYTSQCGLAIHRKCLVNLKIFCAHKKLPKKMTVFGVTLSSQTSSDTDCIPVIVAKCIAEIDGRGRKIKGLYRVSGVKSQVERLCQSFENGPDLVDLSDVHPNVIANVLKLYFRQLPEPLLTYRLYPEFIRVAKRFPASTRDDEDDDDDESDGSATSSDGNLSSAVSTLSSVELQEIHQLVNVVSKLPKAHYLTLSFLMHHLKRVAEKSCDNNMPSSNLGIVFGPTLLRTSEGEASLSSLVDTVHQTRVVDLLITYAHQVFGSPLTVDESGIITGFADPDDDEEDEEDDDEDGNERKSKEYLDDMLLESPLSPPPVLNPRGFGFGRLRPIRTKRIKGEYLQKIRDYRSTGIESSSDESSLQQQDLYSSSDVITIAGQRIITRRGTSPGLPPPPCSSHISQEGSSRTLIRSPVKSASMSTFPFSSIRQLSTMPAQSTMNPSHDSRDWTIESSPLQKSASRQSMNEMRKQFFSIPSTGVNYHEIINRKDSDDGSIGVDSFSDKTSLHHHDPYSSSGVIDEQKVITARVTSPLLSPPSCRLYTEETDEPTSKTLPRFPIKSASMSTFPFNSNKQLSSVSPEPTLSPSQEEKDWVIRSSIREAPLQKSSSRMSMNELRKQFFTIPSTGVNYHEMMNRKDSDDGSESELLSTAILLSSTASHAKLKRSGSGSGHHHLNLPSSTGASSSSDPSPDVSPRRRFLETQMLCNTTGPFSPHPESNVRRAPKFN